MKPIIVIGLELDLNLKNCTRKSLHGYMTRKSLYGYMTRKDT